MQREMSTTYRLCGDQQTAQDSWQMTLGDGRIVKETGVCLPQLNCYKSDDLIDMPD